MTPARLSCAAAPARFLLLAALALSAISCASLDREGKKPVASVTCAAHEYAARRAVLHVFGRHGFRTLAPDGNPIRFERPATKGENIAYKDFAMFESEVINRAFVEFQPVESGTVVRVRAQVIARPDTIYEDAKFPILGTRSRYGVMLKQAAAEATQGAAAGPYPPASAAMPAAPAPSRGTYQVPLPLEASGM